MSIVKNEAGPTTIPVQDGCRGSGCGRFVVRNRVMAARALASHRRDIEKKGIRRNAAALTRHLHEAKVVVICMVSARSNPSDLGSCDHGSRVFSYESSSCQHARYDICPVYELLYRVYLHYEGLEP